MYVSYPLNDFTGPTLTIGRRTQAAGENAKMAVSQILEPCGSFEQRLNASNVALGGFVLRTALWHYPCSKLDVVLHIWSI